VDLAQGGDRARLRLGAVGAAQAKDLGKLPADAERGVHRAARVLVHHRDVVAAIAPQRVALQLPDVPPGDLDFARGDPSVPRQVVDDRERDG
jgi:hypothetical protein